MKFTLGKPEKLKSRKLIASLFSEGKQIKAFPIKLLYLQTNHTSNFPIQVAFSVPKRNFKKAVYRNRIKRLLREVYRKEKPALYSKVQKPYIFMIIFMGDKMPEYDQLEKAIKKLLNGFIEKIKQDEDSPK